MSDSQEHRGNLNTLEAEIRYRFEKFMKVCGDYRGETGRVRFIADLNQLISLIERLGLGQDEEAAYLLSEAATYVEGLLEPLNAKLSRG